MIDDQLMSERRKLKDDQEVDREAVDEIEEEDDMTHQALGNGRSTLDMIRMHINLTFNIYKL